MAKQKKVIKRAARKSSSAKTDIQPLIVFGADHGGFALKEELARFLVKKGIAWLDIGAHQLDKKDDYPDFAIKASRHVAKATNKSRVLTLGVLICNTGAGMCMTANKIKGIRAVVAYTPELAVLARRHNNANVLCLGGTLIKPELAKRILAAFIVTDFEGGRHQARINKIAKL